MKRNTVKWADIAGELARSGPRTAPADARRFWSEFEARRTLYPQRPPAPAHARRRHAPWVWTLGSLGATALGLLAAWLLLLQPAPVQADSGIHSYEIGPDHGSVMILQDETSHATILWIDQLDLPDNGSAEDAQG